MELERLNFSAHSWRFLTRPDEYCTTWKECGEAGYPLLPAAMRRQMSTAQEILDRLRDRFGVLLADDVGMGKTAVAIFVAAVFAGKNGRVRVLAPNDVMRRKWEADFEHHRRVLGRFADHLEKWDLRDSGTQKLMSGRIQIATHMRASRQERLECDLLIVDEAHRARGEHGAFRHELNRKRKDFKRVLFLTATPFSIDKNHLLSLLDFIGAPVEDRQKVRMFASRLDAFWMRDSSYHEKNVDRLRELKTEAIAALRRWVIRHSVEHRNSAERSHYGDLKQWPIPVAAADAEALELLLRGDRAFALAKEAGLRSKKGTNDPRNHVGWHHLRLEINRLCTAVRSGDDGANAALSLHVGRLEKSLRVERVHPKANNVAQSIVDIVTKQNEKVLVFCHHHATATEISLLLYERLKAGKETGDERLWHRAWEKVIDTSDETAMRNVFIAWLTTPYMRKQVAAWVKHDCDEVGRLVTALESTRARQHPTDTIAVAANTLFRRLASPESRSTYATLRWIGENEEGLSKALPCEAVMSLADPEKRRVRTVSRPGVGAETNAPAATTPPFPVAFPCPVTFVTQPAVSFAATAYPAAIPTTPSALAVPQICSRCLARSRHRCRRRLPMRKIRRLRRRTAPVTRTPAGESGAGRSLSPLGRRCIVAGAVSSPACWSSFCRKRTAKSRSFRSVSWRRPPFLGGLHRTIPAYKAGRFLASAGTGAGPPTAARALRTRFCRRRPYALLKT